MRVSKIQKAQNRSAILQAAAMLFRKHGFESVTVAQVMDAAGLTHGGFYGHFESKDDLIAKALEHVLNEPTPTVPNVFADYAAAYLSPGHRDAPESGCTYSTLGTEVARLGTEARHAMTASMKERVEALSATAPGATPSARRQAAISAWSAMVGAMMLSRISDDQDFADELLRETKVALFG